MRKRNIQREVQKSIQNLFLEFLSIFSLSGTKSGKKHVFCDFLKTVIFGQNLTLQMYSL